MPTEGLTASDALKEGLQMIQQYARRLKEMYTATIPAPAPASDPAPQ